MSWGLSDGWNACLRYQPYLAYVDSHPDASGGFTDRIKDHKLQVEFPEELLKLIPEEKREVLLAVLAMIPVRVIRKIPKENTEWPLENGISILK